MKTRSLLSALLFSGALVGLPVVAQATDVKSTQESIKAPESHNRELKVGDKAPDQYKREDEAVKNWQAKGLAKPDKDTHWVEMGGRYVLVNIPNGTVMAIHSGK